MSDLDDLLLPWLSLLDNVLLGARLRGEVNDTRRARARDLLHAADLAGREQALPATLSGGMRQRAALLRTLMEDRPVLLMDEPFSALDATTRASLHEHLLALWEESRPTVVMVTHDVEEAVTLADRIMVMQPRPGRVFDELENPQTRPRDRLSPAFEASKREVLRTLDRSLRDDQPQQHKAAESAGMWW